MEKRLSAAEKEQNEANRACEDIQAAISKLQEEIVTAGGARFQKYKTAAEETRDEKHGIK